MGSRDLYEQISAVEQIVAKEFVQCLRAGATDCWKVERNRRTMTQRSCTNAPRKLSGDRPLAGRSALRRQFSDRGHVF